MYSLTTVALVFASLFLDAFPFPSPTKLIKRDDWGGSVSLGPTKSHIVDAITTISPGDAPPTQSGKLFLWPGMSNGTGDLI